MKAFSVLADKSIRIEIKHVCGHTHGHKVGREDAMGVYDKLRLSVCPLCSEALHNVAKKFDAIETVKGKGWEKPATDAIKDYLKAVDYQKYKNCYVTLHGDSTIDHRPDGVTELSIQCIVSV